jgi:hypothetical protein
MEKTNEVILKEIKKIASKSLGNYIQFPSDILIEQIILTILPHKEHIDIWIDTFKNYPKVVKIIKEKINN